MSEKYILACDSPTLLMTLRWYDFFVRGMIPQRHYIPVKENDKCRTLKFAVEWGNNHTAKVSIIISSLCPHFRVVAMLAHLYELGATFTPL